MVPIRPIEKPASPEGEPAFPPDPVCYLIGGDGLYKQVRNEFYEARVKVPGVPHLAAIGETATVRVPKLPVQLLRQAEALFAAVYVGRESEAVVLLLYGPAAREWRIEVPDQFAMGLHVSYDLSKQPEPPEGFRRFGSIHSHASAKAFHSGTDDLDEAGFDGLHITVGDVDKPVRSYSARWMLAGRAFPAELAAVVEGEALPGVDPAWLARVHGDDDIRDQLWTLWHRNEGRGAGGQAQQGDSNGHGLDVPGEFESKEEYELYLEAMRDELEGRLSEARAAALGQGGFE